MTSGVTLSRRSFLVGASVGGGALTLAFAIPFAAYAGEETPEVTAWVMIHPDNNVIIRVARAEMGQGVLTGLAMLVAEELECDWAKVRTELVSPDENFRRRQVWGDMSTGASRSIVASQLYLRQAGAMAREMLIAAAAIRWNIPAAQCHARNSVITHAPSERKTTFGAVAAAAARIAPPTAVKLKEPGEWRLVGTPRRRLDVRDKITAQPVYAIDVRLPGMLYAAIVQCPVYGGTLKSVDEHAIAAMPGVRRLVRMRDAVAVVADSWWHAKRAVESSPIVWDNRGNGGISTAGIAAFVRGGIEAKQGTIGRVDGDVDAAFARPARRIEADYTVPFLAHATMEPQTCTAHVKADRVEIWVPSQNATTALVTAAVAAGVSNDKVVVHSMMLGGGFGRREFTQDYVRQAVLIARAGSEPVKLIWTREEDVRHDFYRPFGMARLVAGLDSDGLPVAWKIRLAGPSLVAEIVPGFAMGGVDRSFFSGLLEEMPYEVPNYLVDCVVRQTSVPLGVWRAISYSQNAFYRECFIDEMAHTAAVDPYLYRRRLLQKSPRNLDVLDAAAKQAGWGAPLPPGVYRGIALNEACGSYCAQVVELSLAGGAVRVHRVVCAFDCGHVVNPLSIEMQIESGVVYALSAALYGEISIKDGRTEQGNFNDYRMLRMAGAPKVETVLVPSGGFWGGVGEPPVPPLAPALCNAVFAATGRRIRSLPLKNHDLALTQRETSRSSVWSRQDN